MICAGCDIQTGPGHTYPVATPFRGHFLCAGCIRDWKLAERWAMRRVGWEEYRRGVTHRKSKVVKSEAKGVS